jgi:hypothetical protein
MVLRTLPVSSNVSMTWRRSSRTLTLPSASTAMLTGSLNMPGFEPKLPHDRMNVRSASKRSICRLPGSRT